MLRNFSSVFFRQCLAQSQSQLQYQGVRSLYTAESLGLDGFAQTKSRAALQYTGPQMKEKFRSRMDEFLKSDSTSLIFTDDLKTMINLAENTSADISLLHQMIERFHNQSSGLRFGSFVFGPVVMRFFHSVNQPKEILALLKNPKTVTMFDQFMSYQIAMDSLLRNKMYNEVMEVFDICQQRGIQGNKFPKNCFIIALAALFRMNTPESFNQMAAVMKSAEEAGHIPMRRTLTYAAALAVNQNQPELAINILGSCKQQNYVTVRNLKALAFAKVGRMDSALSTLRASLEYDAPVDRQGSRKRSFTKDVMDSIAALVKSSGSKEDQLEFSRIYKQMSDKDMIETQTLNDMLDSPIEKVDQQDRDTWRNRGTVDREMVHATFNQRDRFQRNTSRPVFPPRRPGLGDME